MAGARNCWGLMRPERVVSLDLTPEGVERLRIEVEHESGRKETFYARRIQQAEAQGPLIAFLPVGRPRLFVFDPRSVQ